MSSETSREEAREALRDATERLEDTQKGWDRVNRVSDALRDHRELVSFRALVRG